MELGLCIFFVNWGLVLLFHSYWDFLAVLILMETVVISAFSAMALYSSYLGNSLTMYSLVCFLTFFVCEAVLGLSLLVGSSRSGESYSSLGYCSLKY
uniref:NADH dehydrogenase subunit 4L n=1 Tax=Teredothyra matocotana TaxID=2795841 RepID=UPI002028DD5C|nr:NADH dehydrogenase subunit 4L [Teredothyra matocotana]UPX89341.1 NADH dehydrogenase subunit 4L [Teredothyra matocotana]